jgi:hypothetical protein
MAAKQVVESIKDAASVLPDDFPLYDIWGTAAQAAWVDPTKIPQVWQSSVDELAANERGLVSKALNTPVFNLGLVSVGIVRHLPASELLRAKGIGEGSAMILKAFGHYAEREIILEDVMAPTVMEEADPMSYEERKAALVVAKQRLLKPVKPKRSPRPQSAEVRPMGNRD